MEERLPKLRVDVKEMNRQSHHAAELRSTWRMGSSRGARCSTRCRVVGARNAPQKLCFGGNLGEVNREAARKRVLPRARLLESAEIARNPSKYRAKCDMGWVDGDGREVKTTNSWLTLRR